MRKNDKTVFYRKKQRKNPLPQELLHFLINIIPKNHFYVKAITMSKKHTGVTPLNKGKTTWQYRIQITLPNGDKIDTTGRRDSNGKPFSTAEAAYTAKLEHENRLRNNLDGKHTRTSKTSLKAIYEHYMASGEALSKAHATIAKQNSMWKNHISKRFGDMEIKNITLADLQNYLHELYTVTAFFICSAIR